MASLKDKYCIVGVGETEYSRQSGRSTRAMAVEAVGNAMRDAGLGKDSVDGMMSYQSGDSTFGNWVAPDLGIRLNFYMDVFGGGSSTEALIGLAMGAIEAGMCHTVAIFRSMNGYSDFRIGGTGARAAQPVRGDSGGAAAAGGDGRAGLSVLAAIPDGRGAGEFAERGGGVAGGTAGRGAGGDDRHCARPGAVRGSAARLRATDGAALSGGW